MTTYTDFVPGPQAPFQFQPTLDGQVYTAIVTWNLFGQRWYLNLYGLDGTRIFTLPVIGSPNADLISSLSWDGERDIVTVVSTAPHGVRTGAVAELTISGASPASYNGAWLMTAQNQTTLTFAMSNDPGGAATITGYLARNVNMAGGYFKTSTLVYREQTGKFEVTP